MRPTGHVRERSPGSWKLRYSFGPASGAPPRPPPRGEKRAPATNVGLRAAYKAETPEVIGAFIAHVVRLAEQKRVGAAVSNRNSY